MSYAGVLNESVLSRMARWLDGPFHGLSGSWPGTEPILPESGESRKRTWLPYVDIRESNDRFTVRVKISAEDLEGTKIQVKSDKVILIGEEPGYFRMIALPHAVQPDSVSRRFWEGMLELSLEKDLTGPVPCLDYELCR